MKGFEGIMSIGNIDLKGLVVEESPNSLIVTAKKKNLRAQKEDYPHGSDDRTRVGIVHGCKQK